MDERKKDKFLPMSKFNRKKALALSLRDRLVEGLKPSLPDLQRIFDEGPKDDEDIALIKRCVAFTGGEIRRQNAEFAEFQESENENDNP